MKNNTDHPCINSADKTFRIYEESNNVYNQYKSMRENQTYELAKKLRRDNLDRLEDNRGIKIDVIDAVMKLDDFVDSSDPDIELSNMNHLFQTAEQMRKDGLPDWFQLTGFIHDLGKILGYVDNNSNNGTSVDTQWGIVGDTYALGCRLRNTDVYPELDKLSPDMSKESYNTDLGIYSRKIGLSNLVMTWGHDEYLHDVIEYNRKLGNVSEAFPYEGSYVIRFHSFYPWHRYEQYKELEDSFDTKTKPLVQQFNKYDLYTKENVKADVENLKGYYQSLIDKYFPNGYLFF